MGGGAVFSADGHYRYWLERSWDRRRPRFAYVLLNPSAAGDRTDDPTTRKLWRISSANGGGGFVLVNLFASVDTHQHGLHLDDAVGGAPGENDRWVCQAIERASHVVVGWGSGNGGTAHRSERRQAILARAQELWPVLDRRELWCVGHNRGGSPRHPARGVRNNARLLPFTRSAGYP